MGYYVSSSEERAEERAWYTSLWFITMLIVIVFGLLAAWWAFIQPSITPSPPSPPQTLVVPTPPAPSPPTTVVNPPAPPAPPSTTVIVPPAQPAPPPSTTVIVPPAQPPPSSEKPATPAPSNQSGQ